MTINLNYSPAGFLPFFSCVFYLYSSFLSQPRPYQIHNIHYADYIINANNLILCQRGGSAEDENQMSSRTWRDCFSTRSTVLGYKPYNSMNLQVIAQKITPLTSVGFFLCEITVGLIYQCCLQTACIFWAQIWNTREAAFVDGKPSVTEENKRNETSKCIYFIH